MKMIFIPITSLRLFNGKKGILDTEPFYNECPYYECPSDKLTNEVAAQAASIGRIVIAKVTDKFGTYALVTSSGSYRALMIFNAREAKNYDGHIRAVVRNTGQGALTDYWRDIPLEYCPGSVVEL